MKNIFLKALLLTILLSAGYVVNTSADEVLLRSSIIGANPNTVIGGVPSAVGPWTLQHGSAVLAGDGQLRAEVAGLVITNLGTTGPVKSVSASLVCGGTGGSVVATTGAVPLSPAGDAEIESKINVPNTCFGPVVLIRAVFNGNAGTWIASTGFGPTSEAAAKDDTDNH